MLINILLFRYFFSGMDLNLQRGDYSWKKDYNLSCALYHHQLLKAGYDQAKNFETAKKTRLIKNRCRVSDMHPGHHESTDSACPLPGVVNHSPVRLVLPVNSSQDIYCGGLDVFWLLPVMGLLFILKANKCFARYLLVEIMFSVFLSAVTSFLEKNRGKK